MPRPLKCLAYRWLVLQPERAAMTLALGEEEGEEGVGEGVGVGGWEELEAHLEKPLTCSDSVARGNSLSSVQRI